MRSLGHPAEDAGWTIARRDHGCGARLLQELGELHGPHALGSDDEAAVGEAQAVCEQLDRRLGLLVEFDERAVREIERAAERQVRTSELGPNAHKDAAQDLAALGALACLVEVCASTF